MMLVRSSLTNPNLLHNVTQIIEMRWWLDILELLSSQVMIDWNPVSFNKVLLVNLDSSSKHKSHSVVSDSLWPTSPWNSPGPNTGVNSLSLLQGIFPTQGSNPGGFFASWATREALGNSQADCQIDVSTSPGSLAPPHIWIQVGGIIGMFPHLLWWRS